MENNNNVDAAADAGEDAAETASEKGFFELEAIVDVNRVGRRFEYKIRWEGYTPADDTWEPESNILGSNAATILAKFKRENKEKMQSLRGNKRKTEDKEEVSDEDVDMEARGRWLEENDDFYEEKVSEVAGEKKKLVDMNKLMSKSEMELAQLSSRERVTRNTLRVLTGKGDDVRTSASVTSKTPRKAPAPRKASDGAIKRGRGRSRKDQHSIPAEDSLEGKTLEEKEEDQQEKESYLDAVKSLSAKTSSSVISKTPRKAPTPREASEGNSGIKRGRGRSRKDQSIPSKDAENEEDVQEKDAVKSQFPKTSAPVTSKTPRKASTSRQPSEGSSAIKRGRGRSRMDQLIPAETSAPVVSKTPRKAPAPREASVGSSAIKRGRGRSRKEPSILAEETREEPLPNSTSAKLDAKKTSGLQKDQLPGEDVDMEPAGRWLEENDEFYGEPVSEVVGEKKKLVDMNKLMSKSEMELAKLGSRDRVTRNTFRMLTGKADEIEASPPVISKTPRKAPTPRRASQRSVGLKRGRGTSKPSISAEEQLEQETPEEKELSPLPNSSTITEGDGSSRASTPTPEESIEEEVYRMIVASPMRDNDSDPEDLGYDLPDFPVFAGHVWEAEMRFSYDFHVRPSGRSSRDSFLTVLKRGGAEDFAAMTGEMAHEEFLKNARCVGEDGKNCLHLLATAKCDERHGVDDILGMILRVTGRELLGQVDLRQKSPLHYAISSGALCHVKPLLHHLAPLSIRDCFGQTPLQTAYRGDDPAILRAILCAGGNFAELDNCDNQPSKEMAEELDDHTYCVSALLESMRGSIFKNGENEIESASSPFVFPMHEGPHFAIEVDRTCGELDPNQRILLVIYICSFQGRAEKWTARCCDDLPMSAAPQLNGEVLKPAFKNSFPMVYECPMKEGRNQISIKIKEHPELSGLILAAQAIVVERRKNDRAKKKISV